MFNALDGLTEDQKLFVKNNAKSDGWFNYADFYEKIVKENNFERFVEVGVWKGYSIIHLAKLLLAKGAYFELSAVDYWDKLPKDNELWEAFPDVIPALYNIYNYNVSRAGVRGHIFDFIGNSAQSADAFSDKSVDFVFIDGSHDFEAVKADIEAWKPKIRKGGILAGHDFHNGGVRPAIEATLDRVSVVEGCDVWYTRIN